MHAVERQPTVDDVHAYAQELRVFARSINNPAPSNPNHNPYASVWSPTAEYAGYLSRKLGPAKALIQLEYRAQMSTSRIEMHADIERARVDKERRRRDREHTDLEELRRGKSAPARISSALTSLHLLAEGKTASVSDITSGGVAEKSKLLMNPRVGEEYTRGLGQSLALARKLEQVVERMKIAPLPPPKLADRDGQLKAMRGYSPHEIAVMDPQQGLPRQIEERREAFGLDAQTGEVLPALRAA